MCSTNSSPPLSTRVASIFHTLNTSEGSRVTLVLSSLCQGVSKTGSILDVQVPVELQQIYEGPLKGDMSLLNA